MLSIAVNAFLENSAPLIDVRSPAEFEQGHIPGASNLPLFSNEERCLIGTTHKQLGSNAATQLGLELVGPRLGKLAEEIRGAAPEGNLKIYCWRGGMRSGSVGWLAKTIGLEVQLLDGGYKRFRNWALALFEQQWPLQILGGGTGSGKTEVLQAIAQKGGAMVDLEALASHRGSSFGALGLPAQPSSEHFENCLAICLHKQQGKSVIWLEAESAQVGRCRIPNGIWKQMQTAPLVLLERPKLERISLLVEVYGRQEIEGLIEATQRLSRRLGPQRTAIAVANIRNGNLEAACAEILDYYDRYYIKELQKRQMGFRRIAGEGKTAETIAEMLMQLEGA